ncbi:L,D-transpeptidase [Acuticoccus mangrovi]|uniref:L,D-transpeptidase n=1 Tax=Acuticoccus mangrovi TaxID=2796142 RepID=A0A934IPF7_9HYPH|nr:L,D-transpeptidase [Acuticoccus mangrovi]MBJ3775897.1 L,D-transpeptidase [Acuticoccus mangrovi]
MTSLRPFLALLLALAAGACTTSVQQAVDATPGVSTPSSDQRVAEMYGTVSDSGWTVPAVQKMQSRNVRKLVDDPTGQPAGTLVVDPRERYLYLVMEGGKAMRYGVGVGKAGLEFTGEGVVGRKATWPGWRPTDDMIARDPDRYAEWRGGMAGGIDNPLGARALYLYKNGQDTLYRIHGTNQPWSIGQAVSSGCIRMLNQDVMDLYRRVPQNARVVVLPA